MTTPFVIISVVFNYFGVPIENRQRKCRKRELVNARQISMYYLKKYTKQSLSGIGGYFALDHATVLHSIRLVNDLCDTDKLYKQDVDRINNRIFGTINIDEYRYAQYDTDKC